jgi:hypothetical protein
MVSKIWCTYVHYARYKQLSLARAVRYVQYILYVRVYIYSTHSLK